MSEKRKDKKGRLLWNNEFQRSDGRYEYKYIDGNGERHSVYSWKLTPTDAIPKGKRCDLSLRELEQQINRDLEDGISVTKANKTILNDFFDDYIAMKVELKTSTRVNYKYMYDKYVRDDFGKKKLASIKYSDIKKFYISLIHDLGFKPNSMEIINTILHPVFETALRDNIIRSNPTNGIMADIKRSHNWEKPKRHALTVQQQEAFVSYVKDSKTYQHWLPLFTVLLGTGCRIGEILGLRWEDCDFARNNININHNLIYRPCEDGKVRFQITTPKTKNGCRDIPMLSDVKRALLKEKERQFRTGPNTNVVDGYTNFIFQNRFGEMLSPHCVNRAIDRIIRDYNAAEENDARKEHRDPILIPHFSVHNLRHTFCTRFCENETNLKVIQEIMGHADISTTMDVYNEATREKKQESFINLDGKIKIG